MDSEKLAQEKHAMKCAIPGISDEDSEKLAWEKYAMKCAIPGISDAEASCLLTNAHDCTGYGDDECVVCSAKDCPQSDPMHNHHDGCPTCYSEYLTYKEQQESHTTLASK